MCLKDTSGPGSSGQAPREVPPGPHLHPPPCTLTCTLQQPQPWDLALSYFSLFLSSWRGTGEQGPRPAISLPEGPRGYWRCLGVTPPPHRMSSASSLPRIAAGVDPSLLSPTNERFCPADWREGWSCQRAPQGTEQLLGMRDFAERS